MILESTTYPGTTEELILPLLQESGMKVGRDFFLAFSPERVDPGNGRWHTGNIPKVVGGIDAASTEVAATLYRQVNGTVVPVSSAKVAEMVKLLENTFRAVNIGMVNELALMCRDLRVDVWEVIEAASTKPFGFMPFYPGPGLGGHCIPVDPFYLAWKAAEHGGWTRFIELAAEINAQMPRHVVEKLSQALNEESRSVKGSRVLVLGLSYKANVDDDRESPSYEILSLLRQAGALVDYCDPYFPVARKVRKHDLALASVPCAPEVFARYDALVIVTPHDVFRDRALYRDVRLVVDTRNLVEPLLSREGTGPARVVKA